MALQAVRDHVMYNYGYYQGRVFSLGDIFSKSYALTMTHLSSFITLPLPLLSFLAVPFFGSSSTSLSLTFFVLTWTTLVFSHDPLHLEIYGTLVLRLLFFLLPSLLTLAFDVILPSLSTNIKAQGDAQLPTKIGSSKLRRVTAVSVFNTLLAVGLQCAFEYVLTEVTYFRSGLRVSSIPPMPLRMVKDLLFGIFFRGFLHYAIHRYVMHAPNRSSVLARWHADWAHSIRYPFSLAAAYDHPVCYILAHWVPMYLPAVLFRFHVLTWHLFVIVVSIEQLAIYSGYSVLPSQIMLAGMARRTDSHYATGGKGNFGHWGVLDWMLSSGCPGEADIVDDVHDEAEKRDAKRRVSDAVQNAGDKVKEATGKHETSPSQGKRRSKRQAAKASDAS